MVDWHPDISASFKCFFLLTIKSYIYIRQTYMSERSKQPPTLSWALLFKPVEQFCYTFLDVPNKLYLILI